MSSIFGEILTLPQRNGPSVELLTYGDEFYARYEALSGHTVIYDQELGLYCYALVLSGRFASSGVPVRKPVPVGIPRHLRESEAERNRKFEERFQLMRGARRGGPLVQTFGRENGLLEGRRVSSGRVRGLTVLVQFKDQEAEISGDDVSAMLNADNYSRNGNHCSVYKYFELMSAGKLEYVNQVVGPITLSRERDYYISNLLVEEVMDIVVNDLRIDLEAFDSRNEGYIDALSFMYAGRTVYSDWLWPHNFTIDLNYDGIRTNYYTIQSMGRRAVDLSIGTFCHESGHMLCRFPDIYDYGTRDGDFEKSAGIGRYCLMGSGNHLNRGRTPSPVCAYLRDLVGWAGDQVLVNSAGEYHAKHGDYGSVLRYDTENPNEYFLLENRSRIGLDEHLPSSGLAVYHCDTLGSNEWQKGGSSRHYQVSLLQADGKLDLEQNLNTGDEGDMFAGVESVALSDITQPSSLKWDGSDSGMLISDISAPGDEIKFTSGDFSAPSEPSGRTFQTQIAADLLIPDDARGGVASEIQVAATGVLEAIEVEVDITHTYIGDLKLTIESPTGTQVLLRDQEGGSQDDLIVNYHSDDVSGLTLLLEEPITGNWVLRLSDLAKRDVGRLNQWGLKLHYREVEQRGRYTSSPHLDIPDHPSPGVVDGIPVDVDGGCTDIAVSVDIKHTFIGDLTIELTTPGGKTVSLYRGEGGSRDNLQTRFDTLSTPTLGSVLGEPTKGVWSLAVTDSAEQDLGTLLAWELDLTYR